VYKCRLVTSEIAKLDVKRYLLTDSLLPVM